MPSRAAGAVAELRVGEYVWMRWWSREVPGPYWDNVPQMLRAGGQEKHKEMGSWRDWLQTCVLPREAAR